MFLCFKTPDFRYVVKQIDLLLNLLIKPSLLWSVLGFVHPRKFIDLCRDLPPCQEPHALEGQWRQHKMQNFKYILINIKTGTFAFEIFPDSVTSSWYPVRSLWRVETFHLQRYRFLFIRNYTKIHILRCLDWLSSGELLKLSQKPNILRLSVEWMFASVWAFIADVWTDGQLCNGWSFAWQTRSHVS